ncbi:MAG: aldehyde dehydrogenase family protein [Pigmentiphaga sp.]|uniref:aldehyde dehydrogenase family protein n=1 Tax=Pigmentiphaga sp. TaxID=1977564 RepID=UPI0029A17B87|nr:aldehyde dehydrogenase family protein [Pigmentiphaga sp.]MDX3904278.1 aldehyde dehydrogenase family protein [Pigmentiphaga sp.]
MNEHGTLDRLEPGMMIPYGGNRYTRVGEALANAFGPGDRLLVVQETGALLRIPGRVDEVVRARVAEARAAFEALAQVPPGSVDRFYHVFADALARNDVWERVMAANDEDVRRAMQRGRSTTRLRVSDKMRAAMIDGLRVWPGLAAADRRVVDRVDHGDWQVEVVRVPLGVIGFVFEGRPNVLVDACGVLSTGNAAVLRIGSDALGTASALLRHALEPALAAAGLPSGAVSLVELEDRAAGWAMFSDSRLALAVARGSGEAVMQLSSVARQAGVPVSAHGTGGAWLVADPSADAERFERSVRHSLDRKVCNTLNVCCIVRSRVEDLVPRFLRAIDEAGCALRGTPRLHVTPSAEPFVPSELFQRPTIVRRAAGDVEEPYATPLPEERLGQEWEWEETPELTLAVVESVDEAIALFNRHSPRFVASLIAEDREAHRRFRARIDAPFVGDGFTRWVDGQYALGKPELGLSNWEFGRLLGRGGVLTGADLAAVRLVAATAVEQRR